jgi:hypothetical protein
MAMAAVACRVLVMKAAAVQAVLAKWAVAVRRVCPPPMSTSMLKHAPRADGWLGCRLGILDLTKP